MAVSKILECGIEGGAWRAVGDVEKNEGVGEMVRERFDVEVELACGR